MLPKILKSLTFFVLVLLNVLHFGHSGPLPRVNEQQIILPKIPQWHCLRYFKHDLLMMRRCRHVHVPTAPRMSGDASKLQHQINDFDQLVNK